MIFYFIKIADLVSYFSFLKVGERNKGKENFWHYGANVLTFVSRHVRDYVRMREAGGKCRLFLLYQ